MKTDSKTQSPAAQKIVMVIGTVLLTFFCVSVFAGETSVVPDIDVFDESNYLIEAIEK